MKTDSIISIFDTDWPRGSYCVLKKGNCPTGNKNQSVENASVGFVKGAHERNKFFKKNKQTVMYDKQVRTNKAKDEQSPGRTDFGMNSVR